MKWETKSWRDFSMFSNILAHCQYQDVRCLEQHFLFFFLYQKTFLWFFIFLFYIFVVWCRCIMLWELLKEHLRVLCIIFVDMLCFPNIFCHSEVFCLFQRMSLCLSFCFFQQLPVLVSYPVYYSQNCHKFLWHLSCLNASALVLFNILRNILISLFFNSLNYAYLV